MIIATHCDVDPAPLPTVTGAFWVGCSVKSGQIFKIRHSLTFSTIIPPTVPCHLPLLNGIQGHQKEDKLFSGIFQIIRWPRGVLMINFTIV